MLVRRRVCPINEELLRLLRTQVNFWMRAERLLRTFSADEPLYKDNLDVNRDITALKITLSVLSKPSLDCLHVVFQYSTLEKQQR